MIMNFLFLIPLRVDSKTNHILYNLINLIELFFKAIKLILISKLHLKK